MKIVVFTGAGISEESGIETFRDKDTSLWLNYNIDEVATNMAWENNPQLVLDFHNMLRKELGKKEPNGAHIALAKMEGEHDVTIITQNVDNLHEKAGSTNVLHLHGELFKSRSNVEIDYDETPNDNNIQLFDCYGDLNLGDLDEDGVQLRPHTVLFGEIPFNVNESYNALANCDLLLIIGTSLNITYTIPMLRSVNRDALLFYIDPSPSLYLDDLGIKYINSKAVAGVEAFSEYLKEL